MRILNASDADFDRQFEQFLRIREQQEQDVRGVVADIIADVRKRGDAAVLAYTKQFDRVSYTAESMVVSPDAIASAACAPDVEKALSIAATRIENYHRRQLPENLSYTDAEGITLGWRWTPVDAAGIYVPGGKAAYPSSVLMNAIAAKVAGVQRIVMTVPTPDGELDPAVLVAARLAGADTVICAGGAQAVAALAYGTQTIAPVSVIVGPGNAYVAEAKRQVFGTVGIDMIAGPSEILVVSDNRSDPKWVAADLLSQAEHGPDSQSILITDDTVFAEQVQEAIEAHLAALPRADIARQSLATYGAIIFVHHLNDAAELVNAIAPEHLELMVDHPEAMLADIRHAGAIFMGRHAPEALGDYLAGPNHVLPTSGTAAFSSGLSVFDFMKRSSLIGGVNGATALIDAAATLADAEGLGAHALSLRLRKE